MKKIISLVLVAVLILGLAACAKSTPEPAKTETPAQTQAPASSTPAQPAQTTPAQPEKPYEFQKMNLLYASGYNLGSPESEALQAFADELKERTNGNVTMDITWNGEGFTQDQRIPMMLSGDVSMSAAQGCAALASYYPKLNVFAAPYVFNNKDHLMRFWNSADGQALIDEIAANTGLRILSFVVTGTRCVSLKDDLKITKRSDLSKYTIRMMTAEAWQVMGSALGAGGVVPLGANELYTACQAGTVDGQDNPLPNILTYSLQEVQKSVTLTNHYVYDQPHMIAEALWQTMDPELQDLIAELAKKCADTINAYNDEKTAGAYKTITDAGMKIYELTDDEINAYRNEVLEWYKTDPKGKAFYDTWDMDLYNLALSYQ